MLEAEMFFEKNRALRKYIDKIPSPNTDDEELALWLLKGGHKDWLQLNLNFDVNTSKNHNYPAEEASSMFFRTHLRLC
jgi:hypothetical protein